MSEAALELTPVTNLLRCPQLLVLEGRTFLARRHLRNFVREAWPVVEPSTPFKSNWHIDAICDHLEAVSRGEIQNLLINIPPRFMKSLSVSVMWPAWSWIDYPETRWLFSSYAYQLSLRDNIKSRRLLSSRWFQSRWGGSFRFTGDQNAKQRFENDKTGIRIATSVDGAATGEGGDIIVCDDPHNVRQGESQVKREAALVWWDEVMTTRLNDPNTGRKVIVMQRIHEGDLSGHVLEQGDYEHLCLPLEFEPSKKCVTTIGFEDPRGEEGELLWKDRIDPERVEKLKTSMGPYAYSGQMQQDPTPRKGGLFDTTQFTVVDVAPSPVVETYRAWDKAGTEGGGKRTAGTRMSILQDGRFLVEDCLAGQWGAINREKTIRQTAELDGVAVKISVEQEPGSGGKESAESTVRNLAGFNVKLDKVTGEKEVRAEPYAVQVSAGNVLLLRGEWNKAFIDEHRTAPRGKFQDQWDSAAQAFNALAGPGLQIFV